MVAAWTHSVSAGLVRSDDAGRTFGSARIDDGCNVGYCICPWPRLASTKSFVVFGRSSSCCRPTSRVFHWHVDVVVSNWWADFCNAMAEETPAWPTVVHCATVHNAWRAVRRDACFAVHLFLCSRNLPRYQFASGTGCRVRDARGNASCVHLRFVDLYFRSRCESIVRGGHVARSVWNSLGVVGCSSGRAHLSTGNGERVVVGSLGCISCGTTPICENAFVTVYLITGSDSRLVSAKLTDLTTELIGDGDRNTMFESHDLESVTADERESAIANVVMGAQTESLFGDQRVVVLRGLQEATVDQLKPLIKYLERPLDVTHLVITAEGKLAKSTTDALKAAGATTFNTSPPSRKNDLTTWFMEQFTEAGLKLDSAAIASIIEWLGQDQARLPSLIDVLSSTYGTAKKLSSSDIEPFLGDQGSVLPWDLTDAIDKSDSNSALVMLRRMLRSGEYHPLQVMALLHGHYTKLMKLDGPDVRSTQDAMSLIGSKSDFQAKKYLSTYQRMGSRNISSAVQLLARADIDLRGGKDLEEELIMEILVARLSRLGGGAQRVTSRR